MGNFNKGGKFGGDRGGKKFGGRKNFGERSFGGNRGGFGGGRDGNRERPDMHKAVCSDCGKGCEVPFRPTGDKPVYCSDCFKNQGHDNSRDSRGGRNDFGARDSRPRFEEKRSYSNDAGKSSEQYRAQFDMLNAKLDKLIKILTPAVSSETKETETPKSAKFERALKKIVETVDLRKAVAHAMDKKPEATTVASKKVTVKKVATKKAPTKKK